MDNAGAGNLTVLHILNLLLLILYPVLCVWDLSNLRRKKKRISKMLLMPELCVYFVTGCLIRQVPVSWLMVVGILCGFAGDTLLLYDGMFAPGLGMFLAGHICYFIQFAQGIAGFRSANPEFQGMNPVVAVGILSVYLIAIVLLLRSLFPSIHGGMKGAVFGYMAAIFAMSFTAFLRYGTVSTASYTCVFSGSILFIISDTILAYHVFTGSAEKGIMETYCLAQFLIAEGVLLGL